MNTGVYESGGRGSNDYNITILILPINDHNLLHGGGEEGLKKLQKSDYAIFEQPLTHLIPSNKVTLKTQKNT